MSIFNFTEMKTSVFFRSSVKVAIILLLLSLLQACAGIQVAPQSTLHDRIQIEDLIVRYYVDMSAGKSHDLAMYYTEDAILDVNSMVSKGREEIEKLYAGVNEGGEAPFSGKMHMLLNNAIIDVDGDTATAWFIWTGVLNYDIKKPPRFQEQGREYDKLVKIDGRWYIKERYITADSALPEMWEETYKPRSFR
ncbi:nuclear transport factor 2 family protein [Thermodesulfobacteriota bacterium]